MNLEEIIKILRNKVDEYENKSKRSSFKDCISSNWRLKSPCASKLEFKGIYTIYENDTPIYVGSTGRHLKYRISDLFYYNSQSNKFKHTLTRKLSEKRFGDVHDVWKFYLKSCGFEVIKTETADEARMLEHVLVIYLQHPKYNK